MPAWAVTMPSVTAIDTPARMTASQFIIVVLVRVAVGLANRLALFGESGLVDVARGAAAAIELEPDLLPDHDVGERQRRGIVLEVVGVARDPDGSGGGVDPLDRADSLVRPATPAPASEARATDSIPACS